ncbi:hypothetical protein KY284_020095 [Solanum tuberosum]|nr:hypothetical protein KY284_020095 [Solanum tuberosum]
MENAMERGIVTFDDKIVVRKAIEEDGIPFTYVSANCFAGYFLGGLCQIGHILPSIDFVVLLGDDNQKAIYVDEDDIATYTIKAIDDPRTLNKTLYLRPPENILSQREVVQIWEKFIGKELKKSTLSKEEYLAPMMECDVYKQEPWVTYGYGHHCGGEDDGDTNIFRYFISPRHKKNKTNDRFCRVVGKNLGTWKQQDKGKWVRSKQSKPLNMGRKKSLYYDTKICCPDDGKWLMKECVFCEAILRKFKNSNFRDYCICAKKTKAEKNSANCSRSSNVSTTVMDFSDEQKVDTEVISGVNSVVSRMDQEYKAVTPINIVEPMVQIQEALSGEEKINELLENDDPEITRMWNEDYGMINHPINVVENPAMEVDDVEVQIQEAAGVGSGVLEFENTMPENNLPKEPAHLQQDCPFGVNEDRIASFVGLLSGCGNSAIRNN